MHYTLEIVAAANLGLAKLGLYHVPTTVVRKVRTTRYGSTFSVNGPVRYVTVGRPVTLAHVLVYVPNGLPARFTKVSLL